MKTEMSPYRIDSEKNKFLNSLLDIKEGIGHEAVWFEEVGSTNDVAWNLIEEGESEGLAVFTEYQTKGRGRFGTQWISPKGEGLLFSVCIKKDSSSFFDRIITGIGALSVAEVCNKQLNVEAVIKWPNDILIKGRKVCGILAEQKSKNGTDWFLLGIGINVNNTRGTLPPNIASITTSLKIETCSEQDVDRVFLAAEILKTIHNYHALIASGDIKVFCEHWYKHLQIKGGEVILKNSSVGQKGIITGIEPDGSFAIKTDDKVSCQPFDDFIVLTEED